MPEHEGNGEIYTKPAKKVKIDTKNERKSQKTVINSPKPHRSRLNKDKAKKYIKEYAKHFNKTKALNTVVPDNQYNSNHSNSSSYHNRVMANNDILKEFSLDSITANSVIEDITKARDKAKQLNKIGEWLRANELLGDFIRLWQGNSINISTNVINPDKLRAYRALKGSK